DRLLRSAPSAGDRRGPLVVFDRPRTPGNIGSLARSVDALGGVGLVITGHAADPWDPASIRSSTGSVFAVPVLRCASHLEVTERLAARAAAGQRWTVVGLDEAGGRQLSETALSGQVVLVVGNETVGMSAGWRESCDQTAEIPMRGSASSLNASVAGSIALYEARRQRGCPSSRPQGACHKWPAQNPEQRPGQQHRAEGDPLPGTPADQEHADPDD